MRKLFLVLNVFYAFVGFGSEIKTQKPRPQLIVESVIGTDDRSKTGDIGGCNTGHAIDCVAKVVMMGKERQGAASGTVISDSLVLTAGHVVNLVGQGDARALVIIGDRLYIGSSFISPKLFLQGKTERERHPYDVGIVQFPEGTFSKEMIMPVKESTSVKALSIRGFPPSSIRGSQSNCVDIRYSATNLFYDCDTQSGFSGSPIISCTNSNDPSSCFLHGIHTTGATLANPCEDGLFCTHNSGTRMTKEVFKVIEFAKKELPAPPETQWVFSIPGLRNSLEEQGRLQNPVDWTSILLMQLTKNLVRMGCLSDAEIVELLDLRIRNIAGGLSETEKGRHTDY